MKVALVFLIFLVAQGAFGSVFKHHEATKVSHPEPIKLQLYWESLCPDSIRFIVKQLKPAFEKVSDIFTIQLYPYGKATSTKDGDTWSFECQHGENECLGNKLLACAVTLYPKTEEILPFIFCVESDSSPQTAGEKCATKTGLAWNTLNQCMTSNVGNQILYNMGEVTHALSKPKLNYVPWIIVNGEHTKEMNTEAENDLVAFLCQRYGGDEKPEGCKSFVKRMYGKIMNKIHG